MERTFLLVLEGHMLVTLGRSLDVVLRVGGGLCWLVGAVLGM